MANDVRIIFEVEAGSPPTGYDRVWTGEGILTFEGNEYLPGGGLIAVSPAVSEAGAPSRRLELTLDTSDATVRAAIRDPGPRVATMRWIVSTDGGATWSAVPRRVVGRLSAPRRPSPDELVLSIELESGDRIRKAPAMWSDQDWRQLDTELVTYGGGEYLAQLEAGLTVQWPA